MSNTTASLSRKLKSAKDLQSVVRTMKAIAASQITQYEKSVEGLGEYQRSVEFGLSAYFREGMPAAASVVVPNRGASPSRVGAVVFGSDQGLVGQFNQVVASYAAETLKAQNVELEVWTVGERVHSRLQAEGIAIKGRFTVPTSAKAIVGLVGRVQTESGMQRSDHDDAVFFVFHNRPTPNGLYEPVSLRLLPLDAQWRQELAPWPNKNLPEVFLKDDNTLRGLIGEYLFISIFRACAESLASENASRLAAMERADRNIDELTETLMRTFHRLRQNGIDEELFDVISGYEALEHPK